MQVAKAELLKLEHQLMEEKKQREKELADRRALVQQKVEMNQRMEKRDKMRREMALVEVCTHIHTCAARTCVYAYIGVAYM
jgi:hypothetical protein